MTVGDFDNRLVGKLEMRVRKSGDRLAWVHDERGHVVARTKRPEQSGNLPDWIVQRIRQQLHLNEGEFKEVIDCTIDRPAYLSLLRQKGKAPNLSPE